jgi:hypothetical protein
MIRAWIAIVLIVLGITAARAISPAQQIILFGGNSSASGGGGGGGGSCSGAADASAGCPLPMIGI